VRQKETEPIPTGSESNGGGVRAPLSTIPGSSSNGRGPEAQALAQVDALWADQEGTAYLLTLVPGTKIESQLFYVWPTERDKLLRSALAQASTLDIYVGVLLHSQRDGKKPSCLPGRHLWADCDAAPDSVKLEQLGAMVVESGRPGNVHVYVRLVEPLSPPDLETWNRRLAHFLGADHKWHANAVLRIAGTTNHKPDGGPVTLIQRASRNLDPSGA
jgi:hypothetical protein